MRTSIPWPRVIVEGAVIVVSILLAFGIDAWWEGRQERAEEGRYIAALLDEAYGAANELEIDRQARVGRLAAAPASAPIRVGPRTGSGWP